MFQQVGIRRGVLVCNQNGGWRHIGGSGPGHLGLIPGLEHRVITLPWAKHGEMKGRHWRKTDSAHRHIPLPLLHPGSLTILVGGPDTLPLPRYHNVRGPQRRHRPNPEPLKSEGCWSADGVWAGGTLPPLPSALSVLAYEELVSGETRHMDAGKI